MHVLVYNTYITRALKCFQKNVVCCIFLIYNMELAWCSSCVMGCHTTTRGSIPRAVRYNNWPPRPSHGTVNGGAVSKSSRCRLDVKHNQLTNLNNTCMCNLQSARIIIIKYTQVVLAWLSGSVMDCHATVWGSIPTKNIVFTELHVLCSPLRKILELF